MLKRYLFCMFAAALIILPVLFLHPYTVSGDDALFSPVAGKPVIEPETVEASRRVRPVRINWSALDSQTDELRLNLFENVSLMAKARRVEPTTTGGFVWIGDIDGEAGSTITLSAQNGVLSGAVYRLGREWVVIRYAGEGADGVHLIIEPDPHAPQPSGPDYVIPQPPVKEFPSLSSTGAATCEEDGSVISVMVVYTPAARDAAGGRDAIEALVNQRVSDMNIANDASGAMFDWQLVHTMEVGYVESDNLATDLNNLKAMGDNEQHDVRKARDTYKADLVSMLVAEGNYNVCGYAYQMSTLESWFESYSYSVAALDYPGETFSCSAMTLAHELGHNIGNAHDRHHTTGSVLFPFSHGYQSPNGTFRDIMSYDCPNGCPRINQWSNPDVWYLGEPTGIDYDIDPINSSDNVRSMDETRLLVSNFRADCRAMELTPTPTDEIEPSQTPVTPETPVSTDTPISTNTPMPTTGPTSSPTSEIDVPLSERLYLPAVIEK